MIYDSDRLANLNTSIDVDVRAELARAERLHRDTDSRADTYRTQAKADAAARSDPADKAADLDRQLAEGLSVVANFGGDLRRRNAEVVALCEQVNIERRLNGVDSDRPAASVKKCQASSASCRYAVDRKVLWGSRLGQITALACSCCFLT